MDLPVEVISHSDHLEEALDEVRKSGVIALDIESNSRHCYPEQLCLIQLAVPRVVYIIDALAVGDMSPLRDILLSRDTVKVFHEAANDIRSLDRHYGFQVRSIFDTAVAARFVGIDKCSLENVIYNLLGINIEKSKRLQRSDWGRRPLSGEALEYAAADVSHLVALGEALIQRLNELGRMEWVMEECLRLEDLTYEAPDPETFYYSIKGAGKLKSRELAILRELYLFREEEALKRHRPPFYVIPDQAMVYLAANPSADLSEAPGLGEKILKRLGPGIREAVQRGLSASPVKRKRREKPKYRSRDRYEEKRLQFLKEWREDIAKSLSLNPSLIWPMASLERLARNSNGLDTELESDGLRQWQIDQFALSLAELMKSF